ncbi:MAG: Uma2 family endonuclease [bacterium]|nr:Uma2 family endonuclease [bacterium]
MPSPEPEHKFTYEDYLTWPDDERWELINGTAYSMSPAPSDEHQKISWELGGQIRNFLVDKNCVGRSAPFDVRFPKSITANNKIIDVVQPDIVVICDTEKIDKNGCLGAPDFIIEILSPATASKDSIIKVELYQKNGVKEYWIIDPVNKLITVRLLEKNKKFGIPKIYEGKGTMKATVIPGLVIDVDMLFQETPK